MTNKFIGMYKTDAEYDWRECLILSYGIPLNSEFTEFDFENTLIVDLRTTSQSVGDYLRDLTLSTDIGNYKTFMEFAATRKFQSKDTDVLNQLNTMDVIKKVPSSAVKIKFNDTLRGDYTMSVEEINAMIKSSLEERKAPKEIIPLTERVVREDTVHGLYEKEQSLPVDATNPTTNDITELKAEVAALKEMVVGLVSKLDTTNVTTDLPKKRGRPTKDIDGTL